MVWTNLLRPAVATVPMCNPPTHTRAFTQCAFRMPRCALPHGGHAVHRKVRRPHTESHPRRRRPRSRRYRRTSRQCDGGVGASRHLGCACGRPQARGHRLLAELQQRRDRAEVAGRPGRVRHHRGSLRRRDQHTRRGHLQPRLRRVGGYSVDQYKADITRSRPRASPSSSRSAARRGPSPSATTPPRPPSPTPPTP